MRHAVHLLLHLCRNTFGTCRECCWHACFHFLFLFVIISFFNQLSFKFFSNQLNTFGQLKCNIYVPLVFLRLSNVHDSNLALCRPASQHLGAGHIMMISGLYLPCNEVIHRKRRAGWIYLWGTLRLHLMQSRACQQGLCWG